MIQQRCIESWLGCRTVNICSGNISQPLIAGIVHKPCDWQRCCWQLAIAVVVGTNSAVALLGNRALAQSNIVPDNTLGAGENSVVTNLGLIDRITGGARRGQNLFHSFTEFNVDVGRGAYFLSPDAAIENIFARVTGSNPSEILGTLGTFGDSQPNLFLINPNGIIFGEDSKLDVGGSFVATTANAVGLGDTGRFSASEPNSSNLLNINPDAFFFNRLSNPAAIVNRSTATTPVLGDFINGLPINNGLQVLEGKSLLLLGGDVSLEGGVLSVPGGRVELGGLSESGTVELNTDGNNLSLSFPDDVARADVLLNGAFIGTQAGGGGSIIINAQTVDILRRSFLFTGIAPGNGSVDSRAGDIEINATEKVNVSESSFIINAVSGIGNGGDIEINATDAVTVSESSFITNTVLANGTGTAGDIKITTNSLEVTNGATLFATLSGEGNAGGVKITARDTIRFDGVGSDGLPSAVLSGVDSGAVGNSGGIEIITGSLELTNGAALNTSTSGVGNAGDVKIAATDTVRFDGVGNNGLASGIFSAVSSEGVGNGSEIEITTGSLEVTNGASLNTSTIGEGNAGSVKIRATDTVHLDGVGSNGDSSSVSSTVLPGAVGDGGEIEISTGFLEVTNGAQLFASTGGEGNAGSVKIRATDTVRLDGVGSNGGSSSVSSTVLPGAVGDGGEIEISTGFLEVTNGAQLSTNTFGKGDAGDVKIRATDRVRFDGIGSNGLSSSASSSVGSGALGDGGEIEISTNFLEVANGASVAATSSGKGNAGDVRITASDTVRFDNTNFVFSWS